MPAFTRSLKDRFFAVFLSLAAGIPAGFVIYWYFFLHPSLQHKEEWELSLMVDAFADIMVATLLISILGLIWAICTPAWLGRAFGYGTNKLKKAAIFLLVTIILMVAVGLVWELKEAFGK
jgi:hypothetical protein